MNVICPQSAAVPITDIAFKNIPNKKTELWLYQVPNRFYCGFYAAKMKATGSFTEYYLIHGQRPYNSFDCKDIRGTHALASPDGILSVPISEEESWGVDDLRYIKTLEHLITKAENSGKTDAVKAAADAKIFLNDFFDGINPDFTYYVTQAGFWDYSVYDMYRWQVVKQILNIQKYL